MRVHNSLVFYLLVLLQPSVLCGTSWARSEPLAVLLEAYKQDVDRVRHTSGMSAEEIAKFNVDWRDRILQLANRYPDDPLWKQAITKVVGLSNSIHDYETAAELTKQLVDRSTNLEDRFKWLCETAESARLKFIQNQEATSLAQAIDAYIDALKVADKSDLSGLGAGLRCRYLICAGQLSILLAENGRSKEAATWLGKAKAFLKTFPKCDQQLSGTDYSLEGLSHLQIYVAVRQRNASLAEEALSDIAAIAAGAPLRRNVSEYVYDAASGLYADDPPRFQEFVSNWLNKTHEDDWTPMLRFFLARSFFQSRLLKSCKPIYLDLKGNFKTYFLKKDSEALVRQQGGYYAEILANLAAIYFSENNADKGRELQGELRVLVPEDTRAEAVPSDLFNKDLSSSLTQQARQPRGHSGKILLWGNVCLVAVLVILLVYVRRFKRST